MGVKDSVLRFTHEGEVEIKPSLVKDRRGVSKCFFFSSFKEDWRRKLIQKNDRAAASGLLIEKGSAEETCEAEPGEFTSIDHRMLDANSEPLWFYLRGICQCNRNRIDHEAA